MCLLQAAFSCLSEYIALALAAASDLLSNAASILKDVNEKESKHMSACVRAEIQLSDEISPPSES